MNKTAGLYDRAVEYILSSGKTERQVRMWLARKAADNPDEIVERLKDNGLINDKEYAAEYVRCKKDKLGSGMIRNKLRVNGVTSEIIETALGGVGEQKELAVSKTEKYMYHKDKTPENKSKLFKWLLSKGFDFELCGEVINEYWHRH